jgi:beta-glucosidase
MVLLKNEGGLLPIKKGQYKKIAVIGPCAATNYLGDYSGVPVHNVSLLEGIRHQFAGQSEILYAPGCMITKNGDTISQNNYQFKDKTEFPTPQENEHLIEEAVQTAQEANLVIVAIGENEQLSREAWLPDHFGDANTLDLSGAQEDLVKALVATGKPVIVYLAHGRPLSINWIAAHAPAIVDGWFTGEEAGNAFANILTGQTNPSGKLTISIPKTVGQLPVYYNHKPGAQFFEYTQGKDEPLYPFGYGLSYTTFSYSAPRLSDSIMHPNGALQLSIDITNTGAVQGDEIVQLYIHQKISSVVRPIKELKGFARISLAPGEKKTATFTINAATLSFWTAAMKYAVEPATVEIMVGGGLDKLGKINLAVKE